MSIRWLGILAFLGIVQFVLFYSFKDYREILGRGEWWHFWNPRSGISGGAILACVVWGSDKLLSTWFASL